MPRKTIITLFFILTFALIAKADTNVMASNEQMINLLKQLIMLLTQQLEMLQKQIALQQQPIISNATTTTISQAKLQILSDYADVKTHSVILEWYTNQLTEGKIYLSGGGLESVIFPSEAGIANHHVVHINNLKPATTYYYKIVAIKNDISVLKTGEFKTLSLAVPSFVAKIIRDDYALFNDDNSFYYYYIIQIVSHEGSPYSSIKVKIDNKEYLTDNQGSILYRLKEQPKCGINLTLLVLTDPIENSWTSYDLPINRGCIPTTKPPCNPHDRESCS